MKKINVWLGMLCTMVFMFSLSFADVFAETLTSHAPSSAQTYIIEPADGQTVPETFTVKFGLSEMGVAPAGVDIDNTGHHHLLIDVEDLPDLTTPLPSTEHVRHFGNGQTEASLTLPPGKHTLQLVLGNYQHVPHDHPVISKRITIATGQL